MAGLLVAFQALVLDGPVKGLENPVIRCHGSEDAGRETGTTRGTMMDMEMAKGTLPAHFQFRMCYNLQCVSAQCPTQTLLTSSLPMTRQFQG